MDNNTVLNTIDKVNPADIIEAARIVKPVTGLAGKAISKSLPVVGAAISGGTEYLQHPELEEQERQRRAYINAGYNGLAGFLTALGAGATGLTFGPLAGTGVYAGGTALSEVLEDPVVNAIYNVIYKSSANKKKTEEIQNRR